MTEMGMIENMLEDANMIYTISIVDEKNDWWYKIKLDVGGYFEFDKTGALKNVHAK